MTRPATALLAALLLPAAAAADPPPLLPEPVVAALAAELSGSGAKRVVEELSLHHRMRGSRGFAAAVEALRRRLEGSGLELEIIRLAADGRVVYGTQRSRPAWDADFAELWEQRRDGAGFEDAVLVASWEARPMTLAQDSASGAGAAELVDVGAGTAAADYAGKEVRGKLVLASAQPGPVARLAVAERGAAGIVSYAQNQRTAWWREDETTVRWGHLDTFPPPATFAFMVSLRQARDWQERLDRGETVRLRAAVRAGQHPGSYDLLTAVLRGADPAVAGEEIVFSCHLDHPRPGANDNASGCATIHEVARALAELVRDGRLPPPRRTLRFVWPPEIEGTIALLVARPEIASRARAVVHLDMVGAAPAATGAVFHVTRSPHSLPTVANDVAEAFGRFVNEESDAFAAGRPAPYALADPEGGKEALQAAIVDFSAGSDHQVWAEGSWRVPAIYLNDWPDRAIHTTADTPSHIDATKLRRAAFIAAACGYYLARLDAADVPALLAVVRDHALERTGAALGRARAAGLGPEATAEVLRAHFAYEHQVIESVARFAPVPAAARQAASGFVAGLWRLVGAPAAATPPAAVPAERAVADRIYRRRSEPKGPMEGFGYGWLEDHRQRAGLPAPALLEHDGLWGDGSLYAYEALNLVDGRRSVGAIRDELAAWYGPVPLELVAGYLELLARLGVLEPTG